MKIAICADNHFAEKSSVIYGPGEVFSDRLENQLKSFEFVAKFGYPVIQLGDVFDRSIITAEEASCLHVLKQRVDFSNWTFLQGNHGWSGGFDVMGVFENQVISKPTEATLGKLKVLFLPFNAKPEDIKEYYDVIFGHIGIEGIPFGAKGFDPDFIKSHCKLFLNGHLHNKNEFRQNCWNVGSLTGLNFSDECTNNEKGLWILDDETGEIEFIENPYAFNFYKFDEKTAESYQIKHMKTACVSVHCSEDRADFFREKFKDAYYLRLNIKNKITIKELSEVINPVSIDYMQKFRDKYLEKYGESSVVLEELAEVAK